MKILAIDSSGMPVSAAVLSDGTLLAEYTVNYKKTHSQTLVPMLDEIRRALELDLDTLDAIAVAGGPGSFTGLRIGSATAKGIGLALNKPLIHVPTLEGMAYSFYGSRSLIVPMIDARNKQVFAGIYTFDCDLDSEDPLCVITDQTALSVTDLCGKLNDLAKETGKEIVLLGDGASVYKEMIGELIKAPYYLAPVHLAQQKAGSVAVRAVDLARQGKIETAAEHRPDYLRVSQAERVRAQMVGSSES